MVKRVLSSIALILMTIVAVLYRPVCAFVVVLLILRGLWEFFSMIEKKNVKLFKVFGLILGGVIPISISLKFPGQITREWQLFLIVVALFVLFLLELTRKKQQQTILSLSGTVFGVIYISWCFSFIIKIRNLEEGVYLLAFLISVVKAQDLGAYIIGTFWGKRPLLRRVSPKKSVEGFLGGLACSVLVAFIFKGFSLLCRGFLRDVSSTHVLFLSLILGIIGQLGDLFESLIKGIVRLKIQGNSFPVWAESSDVIDSLIFTAPVFYFYITMLKDIVFYPVVFR